MSYRLAFLIAYCRHGRSEGRSTDAQPSLPGLEITDTGFPGWYRFTVPVAKGEAVYTGAVEVGRAPRKHGKGTLELWEWLGGQQDCEVTRYRKPS